MHSCPSLVNQTALLAMCVAAVWSTMILTGMHIAILILQVGEMIVDFGPDLLTTCGYPGDILSINTTYIVGVGGICSRYNNWTAYSQFTDADLNLLTDNCMDESSAATAPFPNIVLLLLLNVMLCLGTLFKL